MTHHVILGGDAAGMSAAMKIRRSHPEDKITALEMSSTFSYAQCGLPYFIADEIKQSDKLIARSVSTFKEKYGIHAMPFHLATEIDARRQLISVQNLENGQLNLIPYDKLLIATGGSPIIPQWEGVNLQGVFTLKTINDAEKIKQAVQSPNVCKVAIIGGGYIGLEMAEAFILQNKDVTLIERNERVAHVFEPEFSNLAAEELSKHGVQLALNEEVMALEGTNGQVKRVLTHNQSIPVDLVLIAAGIKPNTKLAETAGIQLGVKNAIEVNALLQTNEPNIFAAGDCATQYHRIKKIQDYVPLGTHANKQGRIAGMNMSGQQVPYAGIVGTAIVKIMDLELAMTGLTLQEAEKLGIEAGSVQLETTNHTAYYPAARRQTIKLIFDKKSLQLLGGQVGGTDVNKAIDTLATALYACLTVPQLEELDLAYAPPFSSVWAPVQQAARLVKSGISKETK